jgi:hypothetical protein
MNSRREGTGFVTVCHWSPVRIETPSGREPTTSSVLKTYKTMSYVNEAGLAAKLPSSPSNGPGVTRTFHRASTEDGEAR